MMQHELVTVDEYPQHWGDLGVTIATRHGFLTARVDSRAIARHPIGLRLSQIPDLVDIWHPVPRWMSPGEVLTTIES